MEGQLVQCLLLRRAGWRVSLSSVYYNEGLGGGSACPVFTITKGWVEGQLVQCLLLRRAGWRVSLSSVYYYEGLGGGSACPVFTITKGWVEGQLVQCFAYVILYCVSKVEFKDSTYFLHL